MIICTGVSSTDILNKNEEKHCKTVKKNGQSKNAKKNDFLV